MPRKRRTSTTSFDDDDFSPSDEKYTKDELEGRAPRNAANARERARMRVLSKAFCRLKTTLPWVPADTKLSKLDTLRLAATYIAHLRAVLQDDREGHSESARSLSLTLSWPFALQSTSTPSVFLNNSCSVSSTSGMSNTNQYYDRTHRHDDDEINDVQCYQPNSHQNYHNRHHSHESHQMYY